MSYFILKLGLVKVKLQFLAPNTGIAAESATPCHKAQVLGSYQVWNPLCLTVLAAKSEDDWATAPSPFVVLVLKLVTLSFIIVLLK